MNYANVGYLHSDFHFDVPSDVLRPIGISRASELTGIIYENSDFPDTYDLMITPIPFWGWQRCIRLTIKLAHVARAFESVSQAISNMGFTIVQSEASRSAYRYDTWNISVIAPHVNSSTFDPVTRAYSGVLDNAEKLVEYICRECEQYLFSAEQIGHEVPVTMSINTALAYFHDLCENDESVPLFYLVAWSKFRIGPSGTSFQEALSKVAPGNSPDYFSPSFVLIEMDTKDVNLRAVLLPRRHARTKRFQSLQVDWSVHSSIDVDPSRRSIGLLHKITSLFEDNWTIWRMSQKTPASRSRTEIGRLNFLVEIAGNLPPDQAKSEEHLKEQCELHFRDFRFDFKLVSLDQLHGRLTTAMDTDIGNAHQIAVSCSRSRKGDGAKLTSHLRELGYDAELLFSKPVPGVPFDQKIKETIRLSQVLFVLVEKVFQIDDMAFRCSR